METNLFRFVWRRGRGQVLLLLLLTGLTFPAEYFLLDLPKDIVNRAIGGAGPPFFLDKLGFRLNFDWPQIEFLLFLSIVFLVLVVLNNGLKFLIGIYQGRLSERLLRRMRYELFTRVLRFPGAHLKRVGQGEVVALATGQAEQVGNFTGSALVEPVSLGGQLLVAMGFILVQDPRLALAALALYPVQIGLVPRLQKKVSALAKEKQRQVRRLSEHIGESMSNIVELRSHDVARREVARFAERQGRIFATRYEIFRRKFAIKFLNNFLDKLAPFFFYLIGGAFVIDGALTIGALIAVIAAHKQMGGPWKELLTWYQDQRTYGEIYEDLVEQFELPGLLPAQKSPSSASKEKLSGALTLQNVTVIGDDGAPRLQGRSFEFKTDGHVAVLGAAGSGRDEVMLLLARLVAPAQGRVNLDGRDVAQIPAAAIGRRIAYVGPTTYLQAGNLRDTLLFSLKHRPERPGPTSEARARDIEEARRAGDTEDDFAADWVDLAEAGAANEGELAQLLHQALAAVDLVEDLYRMGLRVMIDPVRRPVLAENIVRARQAVAERLSTEEFRDLVEPFDRARYNTNATVAENLLFGTAVGEDFQTDRLAENPFVRDILQAAGLYEDFISIGRQVAETMVEIFADLPPGHEFFEQFSFISSEDLPKFRQILARFGKSGGGVAPPPAPDARYSAWVRRLFALGKKSDADEQQAEDTLKLLTLPFKLIVARHRLGLIDDEMQRRILQARDMFAVRLQAEKAGAVAFFDRGDYNRAASLQDNILFGKLAYGHAAGAQKLAQLIRQTLEELGLRESVLEAGLDFEVGVGGGRLSVAQRQKLSIARALLRRPDLIVLHDATAALDLGAETRVVEAVLAARRGQGVIWSLTRPELAALFASQVTV